MERKKKAKIFFFPKYMAWEFRKVWKAIATVSLFLPLSLSP
jgi:hypothetical protein